MGKHYEVSSPTAARSRLVGWGTLRNAWHSEVFFGIRLFDSYAIKVFPLPTFLSHILLSLLLTTRRISTRSWQINRSTFSLIFAVLYQHTALAGEELGRRGDHTRGRRLRVTRDFANIRTLFALQPAFRDNRSNTSLERSPISRPKSRN
jgi:hypothetical protein